MPVDLSLLSASFIGLAVTTSLLLSIFRGAYRQYLFLGINIFFTGNMLLGITGLLSTICFCLLGYLLIRAIEKGSKKAFQFGLPCYILLFTYMRNYTFLNWFIPEEMLTNIFSTIGLSFLLFKIIHVMIEANSKTLVKVEFLTYLNYSLNFTTFMMGPIQRYNDYSDQWHGKKNAIPLTFEAHLDSILRIAIGFIKTYVLAIVFNYYVLYYIDINNISVFEILTGIYAFNIFLYLNFSGYCDVVIGMGSLMGIRPPENFNKPFLAKNISDFWLRQHRSLTLWLTDYIFSPLYMYALHNKWFGSRPLLAVNSSLMITMIVSGLWHGTSMAFLIFGLIHGAALIIYRLWDTFLIKYFGRKWVRNLRKKWYIKAFGIFLTFNTVSFSFIFFHHSRTEGMAIFARLLGL